MFGSGKNPANPPVRQQLHEKETSVHIGKSRTNRKAKRYCAKTIIRVSGSRRQIYAQIPAWEQGR
jgi:hypothetical protein